MIGVIAKIWKGFKYPRLIFCMKIEDSLYIKILLWIYEKQNAGFIWKDMKKEFELNSSQEQWVNRMFRSSMSVDENLFDILNNRPNEPIFAITAKGVSVAIAYQHLKEAKESSKRAEKIALAAIAIGVVVGLVQIIISQTNNFPPRVQDLSNNVGVYYKK